MRTRFHFVIDCPDSELDHYLNISDFSARDMERTDLGWCLQAWYKLRSRNNLLLSCSNQLDAGAINLVHSASLLQLKANARHFIVCVRADFPERPWAHYHLVQNKTQLDHDSSFLPFWIQPGLIPRDINRKAVKRVAYTGVSYNGNLAASEEEWKSLFRPHQIEFVTLATGAWKDLSKVDVLMGIRSFDSCGYNNKPASKLLNAWHAGIPFIGGYDSAYRQLGMPGEDYLMAISPSAALHSVLMLRDDASLYEKLVRNGRRKAASFTSEKIAAMWEEVLTGPVLARYARWRSNPMAESVRFSLLHGWSSLEERSKSALRLARDGFNRKKIFTSE